MKENKITVAQYPPSLIPQYYFDCRINHRNCLLCIHWSSRRDLRSSKRYIVELEHGHCELGSESQPCSRYERIPELRARNMTPLERVYHKIYTKKYLRQVLRHYFVARPPQLWSERLASLIADYEQSRPRR